MTLQNLLQEYLERHEMSGREFAQQCGKDISYAYIANIIRGYSPSSGKPPKVSDKKKAAIAKGMGMTLDELKAVLNNSQAIEKPAPTSQLTEYQSINQKITDLIESEIQSRMDEQMKGKAEPIDDPDDWIPLAPGFNQMAPQFQRDFKAAVANVWKLYHDLSNQQRKDEPQ